MEKINYYVDLNILNDQARKEVIDFYEFLIFKYGKITTTITKNKLSNFLAEPIKTNIPYTFNRSELYER
jgi:hypothetical protein